MGEQAGVLEEWPPWLKIVLLLALLVALFVGELHRLSSLIFSDADEGTYVYAGKLLAEKWAIYRDFQFAHPPLMPIMLGLMWKINPGLMSARVLVLIISLVGGLALFSIARALLKSYLVALLTFAAFICSMLLVANMGRTVRLEPVLVTILLVGMQLYVTRPDKALWNVLIGMIFGAALLLKFVAVVPIFLLLVAHFIWPDSGNRRTVFFRWSAIALGGALVLCPAAAILLNIDHFWEWTIQAQALRPREPFGWRLEALRQSFVRCPLLPLGLLAAVWMIFSHHAAPMLRSMALIAVGTTTLIAILFKSYATYYVVVALPWTTLCLVAAVTHLLENWTLKSRAIVFGAATFVLGGILPISFAEVYHRRAFDHVEGPRQLLALLPQSGGAVYSMAPDFNLWAKRDLPNWYFVIDSYLPRLIRRLGDADFKRMLSCVDGAILFRGEFDEYPQAQSRLKADFRRAYLDNTWELWIRDINQEASSCELGTSPRRFWYSA